MSAKLSSLTVFFPYLNDSPAIESLLVRGAAAAEADAERYELLVIDDGSSAEEAARLDAAAARRKARVVRHERNLGYGAAVRRGLAESRSEWVFYTDGDGQYDPAELLKLVDLWRADDKLDFLNGRKVSRSDPFSRRLLGSGYRLLARAAFGAPVSDVNCDFRLMRTSLLRGLALESQGGGIGLELTLAAAAAGARFSEADVTHLPRLHGESQFFRPRGLLQLARDLGREFSKR
jgi:glycosyltransferase involved in cell wall biosynthesis